MDINVNEGKESFFAQKEPSTETKICTTGQKSVCVPMV